MHTGPYSKGGEGSGVTTHLVVSPSRTDTLPLGIPGLPRVLASPMPAAPVAPLPGTNRALSQGAYSDLLFHGLSPTEATWLA